MECDAATILLGLREFALILELGEYLGMVVHLESVSAVVCILLAEGVEAMRTGCDDSFHAEFLEGHHVRLGQHLEQELVARSSSGVARAPFLHSKYADIQARFLE